MNYINENNQAKCHAIIHFASATAGATGAGLSWFPLSDAPLISAAQIAMTISLGKVFGIEIGESAATAAVAAAGATAAGRAFVRIATFWIPFFNMAISTATAVALTEYVGWTMAEKFAKQAGERLKLRSSDEKESSAA
jgi:uncharacterized protein (DUF697 family)